MTQSGHRPDQNPASEIADTRELPVQADRAHEGGAGDLIVADVVDLDPAGVGVAQDHVGFARHAAEVAEAHDLPVHADVAQEGGVGDVVVADVVDLEAAGGAVAQDHVGRVIAGKGAEAGNPPLGPDLTQGTRHQDRIVTDIVNLIAAVGTMAQDHVGSGAGRWRWVHSYGYIFQVRGYCVVVPIAAVDHLPDICAGSRPLGQREAGGSGVGPVAIHRDYLGVNGRAAGGSQEEYDRSRGKVPP